MLIPLGRLRAQNILTEVRATSLRFSPAEMATFLHDRTGSQFSSEDVLRLDAHTEGWVAGLQLVAILLQGQQEKQGRQENLENQDRQNKQGNAARNCCIVIPLDIVSLLSANAHNLVNNS